VTGPLPLTPARRAILAVGVPVALAVIALGVRGWVRTAVFDLVSRDGISYPVALSVPASGGHVRVTASSANVSLRVGAGSRIRVRGTISGSYSRPVFTHRSTAAGLNLAQPRHHRPGRASRRRQRLVRQPGRPGPARHGHALGQLG
jgi:hypothetical protein